MFPNHTLKALILAGALALPVSVQAFGEPYQPDRFDGLIRAGKPVLVHIHAPWCPTCRAQDKRLTELFSQPGYRAVTPLEVSFDHQKDAVRGFRASQQSTLIGYREGREVGRLVGETRADRIGALLDKLR